MNNILRIIEKAIDEKKGEHVVAYDFRSVNPFIDEVVICSASNMRQVYAIAENIRDHAKEQGLSKCHMEGNKDSKWILLDLDTVIVHVFYEEEREIYKLERLYADLPQIELTL